MAGHSAWKNIQARKSAQDAKKGKIFSKIAKEITVAARIGGGDPEANPRLRLAISKARSVNMTKDNIDRAIKRGTGDSDSVVYSEKLYEGYARGGIAIMVQCLSDNLNRTISDLRHIFTKYGGNLGTEGSVSYMFKLKGLIVYDKSKIENFDELFEIALNSGAEDIKEEGDVYEIVCAPSDFTALKTALDLKIKVTPLEESLSYIPNSRQAIDEDKKESLLKLLNALEDNDDVQEFYHNADL